MKEYGDEGFIHYLREELENARNQDIQKGSVWMGGEEMLFSEREIIKKKLWMWLPVDFKHLDEEIVCQKYPGENRPDIIYTSEDTTVNVCFSYQQPIMADGRIKEFCDGMEQAVRNLFTDESILDRKPLQMDEIEAECLAFETPAADAQIYNRMIFMSLEGRLLIVTCNCLAYYRDDWEELFEQMIASIRKEQ